MWPICRDSTFTSLTLQFLCSYSKHTRRFYWFHSAARFYSSATAHVSNMNIRFVFKFTVKATRMIYTLCTARDHKHPEKSSDFLFCSFIGSYVHLQSLAFDLQQALTRRIFHKHQLIQWQPLVYHLCFLTITALTFWKDPRPEELHPLLLRHRVQLLLCYLYIGQNTVYIILPDVLFYWWNICLLTDQRILLFVDSYEDRVDKVTEKSMSSSHFFQVF